MGKEIKNIWINPDWKTMGDSMCFDSGTTFLEATISTDKGDIDVAIKAQGHVKVYYKDELYKHANQMPQELIEKFKDGSVLYDDDCYITENNWWETLWGFNGHSDGEVFEIIPCDFEDEQDIREWLLEFADYVAD